MRLKSFLLFLLPVLGHTQTPAEESEEQSHFLRRIADFWQEGEYQMAKGQMEEFLKEHPQSPFADLLSATLGDLYFREKKPTEALSCYSRIQNPEWADRVFLSRMQCLYEMQWYATLADECEARLKETPSQEATYFLAISLYNQCLNMAKDPEMLKKLAERARPHFETLLEQTPSKDLSLALAHLLCILKEFPLASNLYEQLAEEDQEMLFQAALVQAEFDKPRALDTFTKIYQEGLKQSKEAAFNRLVLLHELGRHEELALAKQEALSSIPEEKQPTARLFLGKSLLATQQYKEAAEELSSYIESAPTESLEAALMSLVQAATLADDTLTASQAIAKWKTSFESSVELPKALFARAQTLKAKGKVKEAKSQLEELLTQFPDFPQTAEVTFEKAHIEYQEKNWSVCRTLAEQFLTRFSSHPIAPFAVRYLLASSAELDPLQFQKDLLQWGAFEGLSETEKTTWQFFLSKTEFDLGNLEKAKERLKPLLSQEFPEKADAWLLFALCQKGQPAFIQCAEEAMRLGARLMAPEQLHIQLFNAYLQESALPMAADHLYAAFEAKAPIQAENLLWLVETYQKAENVLSAKRSANILEHLLQTQGFSESLSCKLAKSYLTLNRPLDAKALLENYPNPQKETKWLLAKSYLQTGKEEEGEKRFDEILEQSANVRDWTSAAACLESARLKLLKNRPQAQVLLKDLILQKTLSNEPLHLEAALEYAEMQKEKKLSALIKIKSDFEREDDLLSKDYHAARKIMPEKDQIYQAYMLWIDSEIARLQAEETSDPEKQKELQAKAKQLLLQIKETGVPHPLLGRIHA